MYERVVTLRRWAGRAVGDAGGWARRAAPVDPVRRPTHRSARGGTRAQRAEQAPRAERRPLAFRRHGRAGPVARSARGAGAGLRPPRFPTVLRYWSMASPASRAIARRGDRVAQPPRRRPRTDDDRRSRRPARVPRPGGFSRPWNRMTSSATASAPPRLARSSRPPRPSSLAISTWKHSSCSRMPGRSSV
jgi:hypothetical protein